MKLKDEIVFGCGEIFRMPNIPLTYYQTGDLGSIVIKDILNIKCKQKFIHDKHKEAFVKYNDNIIFIYVNPHLHLPKFSFNCSQVIYGWGTSVHTNLQLAVHMGCNPIFLVGQDWWNLKDFFMGTGYMSHFYGYERKYGIRDALSAMPGLIRSNLAMLYANKILKKHGIHVYNLTKGTKLKAFEKKEWREVIKDD